jgi:hypothetical protein
MKTVRSDIQQPVLYAVLMFFGLVFLGRMAWEMWLLDEHGALVVMLTLLMLVFFLLSTYFFLDGLSTYCFDDQHVIRRGIVGRGEVRWSEVTSIRFRRSGGTATAVLAHAQGKILKIAFRQLGSNGDELLSTLARQLEPILAKQADDVASTGRTFRRYYLGAIPMPGAVTVQGGNIKSETGGALAIDAIREVQVKERKSLAIWREYVLYADAGTVKFSSQFDDSPILLRFLKSRIPEERWRAKPMGSVVVLKLMMIGLAAILVWATLGNLSAEAPLIAADRSIAGDPRTTRGTVTAVIPYALNPRGRVHLVEYRFELGNQREYFGSTRATGDPARLPEVGSEIGVEYSGEMPEANRAVAAESFQPLPAACFTRATIIQNLFIIPYIVFVLAFRVREDPLLPLGS